MREHARVTPRPEPSPSGMRVVIDLRPLQEPEHAAIAAAYLEHLLAAFAADPVPGESFVPLVRGLRPDPTEALEASGLVVAGRRWLPPTARLLRAAGLTLDSFLLRAAAVGATSGGPASPIAVYHTAGGAVPLGSSLPVVATLLDLAPWELPAIYAASPAARFGHRLRTRILRDATRLIVCSRTVAESARRRVHIDPSRIAIVPLAPTPAFAPPAGDPARTAAIRTRLGLPERYLAFAGRFDARKDFASLFAALDGLRKEEPPAREDRRLALPWPPVVVVATPAGVSDEERDALTRAVERHGLASVVRVTPPLVAGEAAALEAGARGFVYPARSEATGLQVIDALALGVPVVASRVGALTDIVGPAGILVEPRDPARLAAAVRAIWAADRIHEQLARVARQRAEASPRSWADVARETRDVYAAAALERRAGAGPAESE
jgi:glycosyltransferase involved in cell wall biosynthesis